MVLAMKDNRIKPGAWGESKQRIQIMLTPTAIDLVDTVADEMALTRTEVIERLIRSKCLDAETLRGIAPDSEDDQDHTSTHIPISIDLPVAKELTFRELNPHLPPEPDYYADGIEGLGLPSKIYNILRKTQVNTIGDLMYFRKSDLTEIKGIGEGAATEIVKLVKDHYGVELGGDR